MRYFFAILTILSVCASCLTGSADAQISSYQFDGDLTNGNVAAPDGTFRQGTSSLESVTSTATFGVGVLGDVNGALRLDGVDDWVDLTVNGHPSGDVAAGSFSGPGLVSGTVMAWFRTSKSLNGEDRWLMGSHNATDEQAFELGYDGTQFEMLAAGSNQGDTITVADSTNESDWDDNLWHHLAFSWDFFVPGAGKVYLDGSPLTPTTNQLLSNSDPQSSWEFPMAVGARNNEGTLDGFWHGMVDDLQIYAELLTDGQVLAEFNATTPVYLPIADFDSSGLVDGEDFLTWQQNNGIGTTFAEGNATEITGDTVIDGDDLSVWAGDYGLETAPEVSSVPEPATGLLVLTTLLAGSPRRLRFRR
ncbi:LamG-like jellyroll fold domain-containing protein [Adhaeretor mobilis]|uniref:LamG-like jellyroll fold domain-containing protein n=1 Tax=Adhaeretor mobilis TaxID=1930276 RepID=A0A517MQI6_9BACT|nr:LamG-like jellyroll fold domain-containing protein [Adhaeretor mobilis]QDS97134.1 hypothetical protein HG15A2_03940 [Adhaeretor mobilis]